MTIFLCCTNVLILSAEEWQFSRASEEHLPLIDTRGIVVNSEGNIYSGNHFFNRINVYDKNGHFKYCLKIDASGGDFRMMIDSNDNISVATVRNDKVFTFDKNGSLLKEESNNDDTYFEYEKNSEENAFSDVKNNLYEIRSPFLYTRIIKTEPNGKTTTIMTISFITWIFLRILPVMIFGSLIIGVSLYQTGILKIINRR